MGLRFLDFDHDADVDLVDRQRPHLPAGRRRPRAARVVPPASFPSAQRQRPARRRLATRRPRDANRRLGPWGRGRRLRRRRRPRPARHGDRLSPAPSPQRHAPDGPLGQAPRPQPPRQPRHRRASHPHERRQVADAGVAERLVLPVAERAGTPLRVGRLGEDRRGGGVLAGRITSTLHDQSADRTLIVREPPDGRSASSR